MLLLLVGIVLVAGCTSPAPTTTPATPAATPSPTVTATPAAPGVTDLLGNWSGTSSGYMDQSGYKRFNDSLIMNVTSQDGHLFKGVLYFPKLNGTQMMKEVAGVIGDDGKTIKAIEYPGGFSDGMILSPYEMDLIFRDQATPSTICIDSLKRTTVTPGAAAPALPAMPNLLGHWNGTSIGLMDQSGYQVVRSSMSMEITGQDGRMFTGQVAYEMNGTQLTKNFAAIFDRDGKTFRTIENPDGFSNGIVISANEIQLVFRDNYDPSRIAIDTFVRPGTIPAPAVTVSMNLIGAWPGTSNGYMNTGSGYGPIKDALTLNITAQEDRLFKGQVSYVVNGTSVTKEVAGVIGRDAKTFETVEYPEGFSDGMVISDAWIHLVFREDGTPSSIAVDTFRRAGKVL
ncbi:MAG: hypothetical protein NT074_07235 [Methanomicrobiales archaeon]|nr:hypothetical protein [Methanomicrobiales archaeon]